MNILALHSDFLEVEPKKKAIKSAEQVKLEKKRIEDCLVVFSAVEKVDEGNEQEIAKKTVKEIKEIAAQVKAEKIVLYPFVHLTHEPSKPNTAVDVLKKMDEILSKDFETYCAPFGWYKAFSIKCKGHPLAELSRQIRVGEKEEVETCKALKAEEKITSSWYIIEPNGKKHELTLEKGKVKGYDFSKNKNLGKFALYEMAKSRAVKKEPPHVALMKKLELADYEGGADPGNMRFFPKGKLVKGLIEEWITRKFNDYGAMEVESPLMYDFEHPCFHGYLDRFPARQYVVQSPNKRLFMRFSACFGQFLIAHDATISYKNLPFRLFEMAKSFRAEKRGELTGLRRLRAFTMPDCHALCADEAQAKEEMLRRFELARSVEEGVGLNVPEDFEFGIRVVQDFLDKNNDYVKDLVKSFGKPALLEVWSDQFFYFTMKYEWNFIDGLDKASALCTDQIDVENADRYGLSYIDKNDKKKKPLILHHSPGAIERIIYALLEKAYKKQNKGIKPALPLWLSPTQVRVCPVSEEYLEDALKLSEELKSNNIRVDVDDRELTIGKKIREAEKEWVPFILVYGEKEKHGQLSVRERSGKQDSMSKEDFVNAIQQETKGKPFKPLPLPLLLSDRPIFLG